MKPEEWLMYYEKMVARGNMRLEKTREMVTNCGGQKRTMVKDPANPLKKIEQIEPFEEAVERIKGEILELGSRATLEQKADQLIAELRRR